MANIEVYTDGGCSGNPGIGGWAYIILSKGNEITDSGGNKDTTNNRMELTAVIMALKAIADNSTWDKAAIVLHTDSQYVKNGITSWIDRWVKNGWKTAAKKPVKNKDLWEKLYQLNKAAKVEWKWVKGHAGDINNERCDAMVQEEMKKLGAWS